MSPTERTETAADTGAEDGENGHVELQDIQSKPKIPVEDDIMQLARLGEIRAIQALFDSKKFSPKYRDEQGISPLHVRFRLI
jgi:hypothetical protein